MCGNQVLSDYFELRLHNNVLQTMISIFMTLCKHPRTVAVHVVAHPDPDPETMDRQRLGATLLSHKKSQTRWTLQHKKTDACQGTAEVYSRIVTRQDV